MRFGKEFAKGMETGESENEIVESLIPLIGTYPEKEAELVAYLKIGNQKIKLFGKADGREGGKRLGDHKTGKKWTQKMADDSEQLTFYNLMEYLNTGKLYGENAIHWIETHVVEGEVLPTGGYQVFKTTRTLMQVLKYKIKLKRQIEKMAAYYQKEIAKL